MSEKKSDGTTDQVGVESKFQPITDPTRVHQLLTRAMQTQAKCVVWCKDQGKVIHEARMKEHTPSKDIMEVEVSDRSQLVTVQKIFSLPENQPCFVMVTLGGQSLCFKTKFRGMLEDGVQLVRPSEVFQVQRRLHKRYSIPTGYQAQVEFKHPDHPGERLKRRLLNISLGGLAFFIPKSEEFNYQPGMLLKEMRLILRHARFYVSAEVRNLIPYQGEDSLKGVKVGIQFQGMSKESREFLTLYITEHAIQYLGE